VLGEQQSLLAVEQGQSTSDDYYTPRWVFDALGLTFDMDVCSPPGGVEWIPATQFFTMADDGLSKPWVGRVWMNPPFSLPAPWVARFIAHGNGICLVPASNGQWFHALWGACDAMTLTGARAMQFVGGGIPIRTVLAAFGEECVEALSRIGAVRRLVR
jgi:hypothetical protein